MEFGSSPLSRCWSMDLNKQMEKPGRNWSRRNTFTKVFVILTQAISRGDSLNWEHFGYIVNDFVPLKVRCVCSIQRTWWSVTDFEILQDHTIFKLKGAFQSHRPLYRRNATATWRCEGMVAAQSFVCCRPSSFQPPPETGHLLCSPATWPSWLGLCMVLSCSHGCSIIDTLLDFFFFWYCFYGKFSDIKVENTI